MHKTTKRFDGHANVDMFKSWKLLFPDLTLEDIEKTFGKNVARLVDGVTKLTKIKFKAYIEGNSQL